jgi:DNA polymerase III epsilon subunit-like protein
MLSFGACLVDDIHRSFYRELRPDRHDYDEQALSVSGLSLESLAADGIPAEQAMQQFDDWLRTNTPSHQMPVFVAFNAPFDWMFIQDYFHRYMGRNPFGHSALDIKALYMGATGVRWAETSYQAIAHHLDLPSRLEHHALQDAQDQALIFLKILAMSE